jgi:hypothetical protein
MGKYRPLAQFLAGFKQDSWDASFEEIERILGFSLPPSAREHRAWWANQFRGNHSQAQGWNSVGWQTREIDQRRGRVRFEKTEGAGTIRRDLSDHDRWLEAERITGISDRQQLEHAAISALIEREAARVLARLGGTMPNARAAPRERPFG